MNARELLVRNYLESPSLEARNRIVVAYMPIVRVIVHKMLRDMPASVTHERDVLEAAGHLAVIRTTDSPWRYDETRGTYATFLREKVITAVKREMGRMGYISRTMSSRGGTWDRTEGELSHELGRRPQHREVRATLAARQHEGHPMPRRRGLFPDEQVVYDPLAGECMVDYYTRGMRPHWRLVLHLLFVSGFRPERIAFWLKMSSPAIYRIRAAALRRIKNNIIEARIGAT